MFAVSASNQAIQRCFIHTSAVENESSAVIRIFQNYSLRFQLKFYPNEI
jgi:hypothetical protein